MREVSGRKARKTNHEFKKAENHLGTLQFTVNACRYSIHLEYSYINTLRKQLVAVLFRSQGRYHETVQSLNYLQTLQKIKILASWL